MGHPAAILSSLRDSVSEFYPLPRTCVLGYCPSPLRGCGADSVQIPITFGALPNYFSINTLLKTPPGRCPE
jgi:hypothetical protein